ncbi:MAG: HAMP domain-containing protein [Gammaproteobacteria bacterium]|nr:HAMP domain-containing protein [Gammaproteobacteria bacterium]
MKNNTLLNQYLLSALSIIVIVSGITWYATDLYKSFFINHLKGSLQSRAITVQESIHQQTITQKHCQRLLNSDPNIRVTIINTKGEVLCDSQVDTLQMENHRHRPEVRSALAQKVGASLRFSSTLQSTLLYIAIPWEFEHQVKGVIRTAMPLFDIEALMNKLLINFYILLALMLVGITLAIIYNYKKINQPLDELVTSARKLSEGSFDTQIPEYDIQEINQLGKSLNDTIYKLGHLENLRQEFVGNVSHELKTPIATIQSYVETLLDGAAENPADLKRFLNIVLKQNNRLGAIVDDLLMLSRLENAPINQLIELQQFHIADLFSSVEEQNHSLAKTKKINIKIECNKKLQIKADHSLVIQAVSNLLNNAIKYSFEKTDIKLFAEISGNKTYIHISDQGPGVNAEHLPRLFERFYRVDKSRSRQQGGTGLGLAIVKHIMQIHNGDIRVRNNKNGIGCCFSLIFNNT